MELFRLIRPLTREHSDKAVSRKLWRNSEDTPLPRAQSAMAAAEELDEPLGMGWVLAMPLVWVWQ